MGELPAKELVRSEEEQKHPTLDASDTADDAQAHKIPSALMQLAKLKSSALTAIQTHAGNLRVAAIAIGVILFVVLLAVTVRGALRWTESRRRMLREENCIVDSSQR